MCAAMIIGRLEIYPVLIFFPIFMATLKAAVVTGKAYFAGRILL
jgi:Trk-type K+ transport system membrane component